MEANFSGSGHVQWSKETKNLRTTLFRTLVTANMRTAIGRLPVLVCIFASSSRQHALAFGSFGTTTWWRSQGQLFPVHQSHRRFTNVKSSNLASALSATSIDLEAYKTELSYEDCQDLLTTAEEAARAAGAIITSHLGCCSELEEECEIKYSIKDIVTEYDKQAQDAIESIVRSKFPDHSFLGEEDVDPGAAASEAALTNILTKTNDGYLWICDPIDGTANFAQGMPLCAVTMGVVYRGTPIVGVVYDPHRDEMFSAIRDHGATMNGEPIQVSQAISEAKDAIINAGCPADPNAFETSMRGVLALNSRCRGIRVVACSALTTAWIACGRLAAHYGYDLSSWDLVAGALLIQEAGGLVTDLDSSPYKLETRNMLCSCNGGQVHEEILSVLREADAVSFTRASSS